MNLYRDRYNDPKTNAQDQLDGRTHYVDDGSLRFHHSRVLASEVFADGLLFGIVESCAADMHNTRRIFRGVLFDVFGDAIYRPDLDASFTDSRGARKALLSAVAHLDARKHTLEAIEHRKATALREYDELATFCTADQQAAA